jgi:CheY-like chemotaxis protein/DNA-binding Xre family transcriptional regulator
MRWSQEDLAERANLQRTYLSDVERGKRNITLATIDRLARALDTSASTLCAPLDDLDRDATAVKAFGGRHKMVEILLVEDDPNDVELTLNAFRTARFVNHVQVVNDGVVALDYIFSRGKFAGSSSQQRPQIVLLDLNLPRVNGVEVLAQIKRAEQTRSIPVVILTTSKDDLMIAKCRQLGASIYVEKPVDFRRLCRVTPGLDFAWGLIAPAEPRSNQWSP